MTGLPATSLHHVIAKNERDDYPYQAQPFLRVLPKIVEHFAACDLMLYQAGADAHIDDPLGGWMTDSQLAVRDDIVFQTAKRFKLPIAWCLAGGYLTPLQRTLNIHNGTMLACANAFAPIEKLSRKQVV